MNKKKYIYLFVLSLFNFFFLISQENNPAGLLTLDRIFSGEFRSDPIPETKWIENGAAYVIIEPSATVNGASELVRYDSATKEKSIFLSAEALSTSEGSLSVESFSLSEDGSKILIFTNSSRVWRSNTKGDYWLYDRNSKKLTKIGENFDPSSLMFAKINSDNSQVFYVHQFNIYKEDLRTGDITQLTRDGTGDIINGTFDWAYEEEFKKRDGFMISPDDKLLAFWRLDATGTGVFYMINNIDSIYSKPIPVQYPKVGHEPSAARVGVINLKSKKTVWIPIEGGERENYIPGMQWVNEDLLLIQQLNRHQNTLTVWSYVPSTGSLKKLYTEKEETYIELIHPDITADKWFGNDLLLIDGGSAFLRLNEVDDWRHVYKVGLRDGERTLVTPFDYDVASMKVSTKDHLYYLASPDNGTQRYLYQTDLKGKGKAKRLTPESLSGVNLYNIAPNGKYAFHYHQSTKDVMTMRFISLPNHKTIRTIVDNQSLARKLAQLDLPEVKFKKVRTEEGIEIDARMIYPPGFDHNLKYPVLFNVYGEPAGTVANDTQVFLWDLMMAQLGYVVIAMDNRGTPCLKGSKWRKSIYRQVGRINTRDQGLAAKEILKLDYLDDERTAVWGWSGGGTMTLNLMFHFPEVYKTGVAGASVSNQLVYDNIYQERYMGLPQENMEDYEAGSPITHAKNLQGKLLVIHGTADDNVHYQSAEMLINELIRQNKQFDMMAYPNRSHGMSEGENTYRHLFGLITAYILEHTPPNE